MSNKKLKLCEYCWKSFLPKTEASKYCSLSCSNLWRRKLKILSCPVCWKEFKQHNSTTKFCSRACANIAQTSKDIKCPVCWIEFHPRSWQKYCSNKCLGKSKIKLKDKECEFCWKLFHPKNSKQKFCSKVCWYSSKITLYDKKCVRCGKSFKPYYKEQKYCSNNCAKAESIIPDIKCETCWKLFHPTYRYAKYCSLVCRWIGYSKYINSLSEEEKSKRIQPLQNSNPKQISSNNRKFVKFLNDNGFETDMEFYVGGHPFDIKTGNTLIEINPTVWHNSTEAPQWKPKWKSYHQDKARIAINHWYNIIMVRDWDNKQDILRLLKWLNYTANEVRVWIDKCMYSDITKSWYKLSNITKPITHRYNEKTKEHIVDIDDNMLDMVENWFVKIYDCWIATFT